MNWIKLMDHLMSKNVYEGENVSRDSSVNIVTRLRAQRPGSNSWQGKGIFLLTTASRPALGPTQPYIEWVTGALSPWYIGWSVKLTTHLHLMPRWKWVELYLHFPNVFIPWCWIKHGQFYLYFYFHLTSVWMCVCACVRACMPVRRGERNISDLSTVMDPGEGWKEIKLLTCLLFPTLKQ